MRPCTGVRRALALVSRPLGGRLGLAHPGTVQSLGRASAGWPVRLTWFGLAARRSARRRWAAADFAEPEAEATLRSLIRRFAEPWRLDRVADGRRASPCDRAGRATKIGALRDSCRRADREDKVDRLPKEASRAQVVLAVLAVIAAPLPAQDDPDSGRLCAGAVVHALASGEFLRRHFPYGSLGALALLVCRLIGGLYLASLTAESLVTATYTLPSDIERLAGQVSGRITDLIRDRPSLRAFLPEPGTIDRLGDTNRALLIEKLSYGLTDFTHLGCPGICDPGAGNLHADRKRDAVGQADSFLRPQRDRSPGRRRGPVADHPQDPSVPDRPDAHQRRARARDRCWHSGS